MARTATAGMQAALSGAHVRPVLLVDLDLDGGALRLWSGIGDLTWGGDVFAGAGTLLGVSGVRETAEDRANGCQFTLSGIEASVISAALTEEYQGRDAAGYIGAIADDGSLIADPVAFFKGFMDVLDHEDGGETATLSVSCETKWAPLMRANVRRWTPEDQHLISDTDQGLDQVAALQDVEVVWGRT
jgi:hypothetical protein